MGYTMRPLKTADIFKMSKILKKMNLKLDVDPKTTQEQLGVQFIQRIAENIYMAEEEINEFLGNLIGATEKEFSELPIEDTLQVIELFKQQKGLASFFKLAGK